MTLVPAHFQLYEDHKSEWRWRLYSAGNRRIIAESGEGYACREACIVSIYLVSGIPAAPNIWDAAAKKYVTQ